MSNQTPATRPELTKEQAEMLYGWCQLAAGDSRLQEAILGCLAAIYRLESALADARTRIEQMEQVDDVLLVNWISVQDGDYRKALHDLVSFNIQIECDKHATELRAAFSRGAQAMRKTCIQFRPNYDKPLTMRALESLPEPAYEEGK